MRVLQVCLLVCAVAGPFAVTAGAQASGIGSQARAAGTVVVAQVEELRPRFERNSHGDQLIVSDVYLRVEEAWKGAAAHSLIITTVEGGTVGALSLQVSDMPALKNGDRAVLFLDAQGPGRYALRNRGRGIMKLTPTDRVEGSQVTLAEVRRAAGAGR